MTMRKEKSNQVFWLDNLQWSVLEPLDPPKQQLGDKVYDSAEFRAWLRTRKTEPVITSRRNRKNPHPLKKRCYRQRTKIKRRFCRLKDACRIATRYDKSAKTYLNAICLIAVVYWWLN